jgi:hypothetical protein
MVPLRTLQGRPKPSSAERLAHNHTSPARLLILIPWLTWGFVSARPYSWSRPGQWGLFALNSCQLL